MKVILYIPFANGDAVNGFKYEGEELTAPKYVKMEENEYYGHKDGVDHMVVTSLGNNMADKLATGELKVEEKKKKNK